MLAPCKDRATTMDRFLKESLLLVPCKLLGDIDHIGSLAAPPR